MAERIELQASVQQNASGNSGQFSIPTMVQAILGVDVTAGSGTISDFDVWLEGSDDGGTTWYELPCDLVMKSSGTGTANTVAANQRNVVDSKTSTTAEKFVGIYKALPADVVRLRWILTGTTPTMTFSASLVGK